MRVVIQRVTRAAVRVAGETVGAIEQPGYLVLVGITHGDGAAQIAKLADKTANLRLLEGEKSLLDEGAPVLAVSQFTLYGDAKKGRRPSWSAAAPGAVSEPLFNDYVQALRERAQGGDAVPEAGAHAHVEPAAPAPAKKPRKARSSRKRSVSNAPTLLGDD